MPRGRPKGSYQGATNPKWRGGRSLGTYVKVRAEGHPRAEIPGHYVLEHILVAEKALGHYLPKKAQVHHRDGDEHHNDPTNLIICENLRYHLLIHARERIYRAGGRPGKDKICTRCRRVKPLADFLASKKAWDGHAYTCHPCRRKPR